VSTKDPKPKTRSKKVYRRLRKAAHPTPAPQEDVDAEAFGKRSTRVLITQISSDSIARFAVKRTIVKLFPEPTNPGEENERPGDSGKRQRTVKTSIEKASNGKRKNGLNGSVAKYEIS
jgi:hypothetical protein